MKLYFSKYDSLIHICHIFSLRQYFSRIWCRMKYAKSRNHSSANVIKVAK
uniref:Ion transport domain-containing protein n=1 Tax=Parascaris univalens TaxID=6257 RepID=A0A915BVF7_PARUN